MIHLHRAKYLMLIWRVQLVGFCALPIAVKPSLSLYAMVAAYCGMFRSQRILQMKRHMRPTLQAAMNSALVDDSATEGWNLVLWAMTPLVRKTQTPVKDLRVLMHVAQLESA